jgi:benzil reductase ((S)-benzoin forming)
MAIALVTGARSGIGKAIADRIATFPHVEKVLAVSRTIAPFETESSNKLVAVAADLTTAAGRQVIVEAVRQYCGGGSSENNGEQQQRQQLLYLIHAAGTIDPIKSVLDVTADELRAAMVLNCEAPLLLTTALYPYLQSRPLDDGATTAGRVLHVSSGAAHGAPPVGWAVYGITKAAFYQSYKVLEREFRETLGGRVVVGSFKPGVVDTNMQHTIRETSESAMPAVATFRAMKAKVVVDASVDDENNNNAAVAEIMAVYPRPPPKGALDSPVNVAYFVDWLLRGTSDAEFANKDDANEYDIRDETLFPKWIVRQQADPPSSTF